MNNRALIVVDLQYDFLPGGALGVYQGDMVKDALVEKMATVDYIVFTRDWHPADHTSFSSDPEYRDGSWPAHCVQNTFGAQIDEWIWVQALATDKPVFLVDKGCEQSKEAYSGFDGNIVNVFNDDQKADQFIGMALGEALRALSVSDVFIGGLALDYCVKATASDALNYAEAIVLLAGTRPVNITTGLWAVAQMYAEGVEFE